MINTEAFLLIAGDPSEWDRKLQEAVGAGADLPEVQRQQYRAGCRSAELVRSIYGWSVRSGTGLNDFAIMHVPVLHGQQPDKGFADAVVWGKEWAEKDPKRREFYVRRRALDMYAEEVMPALLVA